MRNTQRRAQHTAALHLLAEVGLPSTREIEITEFHKFENMLDVQIIVYNRPGWLYLYGH